MRILGNIIWIGISLSRINDEEDKGVTKNDFDKK